MNKYELRVMALAGLMLSIFLFAILYETFTGYIDVPTCIPYSGTFKKPHFKKLDYSTYEVFAVAKMWAFEPSEITLPAGSTLELYLTSSDVVHGFSIVKKGVNLMAVPGGVAKTSVTFNDPRVYRVVCHEYCGASHQNMMSKIIVTP